MENSEISEIFIFCSKSYQNLLVFVSVHFLTFLNLEFHSVSEFEVNKWQNGKWKKIKPQKPWKYYSKFYFPVSNFAVRSKSKLGFKYLWKKIQIFRRFPRFLRFQIFWTGHVIDLKGQTTFPYILITLDCMQYHLE